MYLVLFRNPRDTRQISHLAQQMYPGEGKCMVESYKEATSEPYGYLFVDMRPNTPEHLRLRGKILDTQKQEVYVPKDYKSIVHAYRPSFA